MKRLIAALLFVAMLAYGAATVLDVGVALATTHAAAIEGSR